MKPNLLSNAHKKELVATLGDSFLQDAWLEPIIKAASNGNEEIADCFSKVVKKPLLNISSIKYRQEVIKDVINNPSIFRSLFTSVTVTINAINSDWLVGISDQRSDSENYSDALSQIVVYLRGFDDLRSILSKFSPASSAIISLQKMLNTDFSADAIGQMLAFASRESGSYSSLMEGGVNSNGFCGGFERLIPSSKGRWRDWAFAPSFVLGERDESGAKDLQRRAGVSLGDIASLIVRCDRSFTEFFELLSIELGFYIGALNLQEALVHNRSQFCFPTFSSRKSFSRHYLSLYDMSLALESHELPVSNSLDGKSIQTYLVSGANQGGKTTFLRSLMQSFILGQCGLFIGAEEASIPIRTGFFSHFGNDENSLIDSGRFLDELSRLNKIVDMATPNSAIFLNESFSSTNERDGSIIGEEVSEGLNASGIEVFYVTHFYELAKALSEKKDVLSLIAERNENGERSYKILPGLPKPSSYGEDIFKEVFKTQSKK